MHSHNSQRKTDRKTASKQRSAYKSWPALLCLSLSLPLGLSLTGCDPMVTIPAPQTQPLEAPAKQTTPPIKYDKTTATQCPTFNPEKTMCTMQYDPVCVKVKTATGISYRTGGNACSGCMTPEAISYVPGKCGGGDAKK